MAGHGFEPVGGTLQRRLRRLGLGPSAEAAWICAVAETVSAGRFTATRFRDDSLTLKAVNLMVGHELRLQASELERAIHQKLGWSAERPLHIRIVA